TPQQFGKQFGPDTQTMQGAAVYLRKQGFNVSTLTRSLHVTGNAGQVAKSFGVDLHLAQTSEGRTSLVQAAMPVMPRALASLGAHITGFTPHVKHQSALRPNRPMAGNVPDNRFGPDGPYWYNDLKQAYQYPANNSFSSGKKKVPLNGTGATIAI